MLHPVFDQKGQPATWAAVCAATGRSAHPLMQWRAISRPPDPGPGAGGGANHPPWAGLEPQAGNLEPAALAALCRVLGAYTDPGTACFFALWEGYGWISGSPAVGFPRPSKRARFGRAPRRAAAPTVPPAFDHDVMTGARLRTPNRDYLLFTGPLDAALELGWWPTEHWFSPQSPNLVWPADRSWFVATEIDFDSTVVGGNTALVSAVLGDPNLEAWPVESGDSLASDGDTINV